MEIEIYTYSTSKVISTKDQSYSNGWYYNSETEELRDEEVKLNFNRGDCTVLTISFGYGRDDLNESLNLIEYETWSGHKKSRFCSTKKENYPKDPSKICDGVDWSIDNFCDKNSRI
jgi:hypothetical protein